MSALYEALIQALGIRDLSAYLLIVARKSERRLEEKWLDHDLQAHRGSRREMASNTQLPTVCAG